MQRLEVLPEGDDLGDQRLGRLAPDQDPGNETGQRLHLGFLQAPTGHFLVAEAEAVEVTLDRRQGQADAAEQDLGLGQVLGGALAAAVGGGGRRRAGAPGRWSRGRRRRPLDEKQAGEFPEHFVDLL